MNGKEEKKWYDVENFYLYMLIVISLISPGMLTLLVLNNWNLINILSILNSSIYVTLLISISISSIFTFTAHLLLFYLKLLNPKYKLNLEHTLSLSATLFYPPFITYLLFKCIILTLIILLIPMLTYSYYILKNKYPKSGNP